MVDVFLCWKIKYLKLSSIFSVATRYNHIEISFILQTLALIRLSHGETNACTWSPFSCFWQNHLQWSSWFLSFLCWWHLGSHLSHPSRLDSQHRHFSIFYACVCPCEVDEDHDGTRCLCQYNYACGHGERYLLSYDVSGAYGASSPSHHVSYDDACGGDHWFCASWHLLSQHYFPKNDLPTSHKEGQTVLSHVKATIAPVLQLKTG